MLPSRVSLILISFSSYSKTRWIIPWTFLVVQPCWIIFCVSWRAQITGSPNNKEKKILRECEAKAGFYPHEPWPKKPNSTAYTRMLLSAHKFPVGWNDGQYITTLRFLPPHNKRKKMRNEGSLFGWQDALSYYILLTNICCCGAAAVYDAIV